MFDVTNFTMSLIGRLVAEPEMRAIPSGDMVTKVRVAVNKSWKKQDGTKGEKKWFVTLTVWGKQGEVLNNYAKKGDLVQFNELEPVTEESGNPRVWVDDKQVAHAAHEYKCGNFNILGRLAKREGTPEGAPAAEAAVDPAAPAF